MTGNPVCPRSIAAADGALALLCGVGAHLPILIAQGFVGWNPPDYALVDEFGFSRAAMAFKVTGQVDLFGWASMTLFGLLYWSQLFLAWFGSSFLSTRLAAWSLDVLGPAAIFLILRQRGAGRAVSGLGALALGWSPLYTLAAAPFMTDAPYLALCLVGVLCFERALADPEWLSPRWLSAGALAFVAAGSIRQTAVLGLVAAVVVAGRSRLRGSAIAILTGAGLLITAAYLVARATPGFLFFGAPIPFSSTRLLEWPSLALAVAMSAAPFVTALPARYLRRMAVVFPLLVAGWAIAARSNPGKPPGFMGTALGPGIADPLSSLPLIGLGLLVLAAAPFVLAVRALPSSGVLEMFAGLHGLALIPLFASRPLFDRYGLPLTAAVVVAFAMQPGLSRLRASLSLLVMGALSTLLLESVLHDKILQWELGRSALSRGIPAEDVAIDFTWAGYHAESGALWEATQNPRPVRYRVTVEPDPGTRVLDRRDRSREWRPGFRGRYRYFCLVDEGSPLPLSRPEVTPAR